MPWPRSSISLSIASFRPSTFAMPSPISRIPPTFWRTPAALAPAICSSISFSRSAILLHPDSIQSSRSVRVGDTKALLECPQVVQYAAVIHITSNPDTHPTDQVWIMREHRGNSRSVKAFNAASHRRLDLGCPGDRTFHSGAALLLLHLQQSPELPQDAQVSTRSSGENLVDHLTNLVFVQPATHQTEPEQLL